MKLKSSEHLNLIDDSIVLKEKGYIYIEADSCVKKKF